jgi:hypothetical protein
MKKSIAGIACFGMFLVFAQPHASAADFSLSGMKFGQSVEDAQAVYKGLSPTEDINMGQVTIPPIAANPITYRLQGSNYDNKVMDMVVTYFTVPPEKQQLWYITRSINYGDNKSAAPLTDAVISGLKDKYGAPTAEPDKGRTFLWVMDANGAPLTDKKQIDSILHFCTPTDPASVSLPDNIDGNHGMFERYCKSNIIVRALIEGASGQPVLRYAVWMQNTAIRTAADAKSAELVMKAENAKQQQEKDNAAKNAPKF